MEKKLMRLVDNFEKTAKAVRKKRRKSRVETMRVRWERVMHYIFVAAIMTISIVIMCATLIWDENPSIKKMVQDINLIKNLI